MTNHTNLIERLNSGEWWQTVIQGPNPTGFSTGQTLAVRQAAQALSTLTAEVEELRIDCEFLLSVIDSCDEAEAPSCEMEPEDIANIRRIRATLTKGEGDKLP